MNFAYLTEYSKLGFTLPRNEEFVYRNLKCSLQNVNSLEEQTTPSSPWYAIRFCNVRDSCHLVAVANEDGTVRLHDSRRGREANPVETFQAHYNAIFDLVWLENEVKLVTSSGDHSALLWDLGKGEAVPIVRMVGHQGSVKAVACKPGDSNVFTTGARDGNIMQWDIRTNPCRSNVSDEEGFRSVKADKIIKFSHLKNALTGLNRHRNVDKSLDSSQCISSVVYQDTTAIISSSSTDKYIKVWDTRKTYSAFKGIPTPMYTISRESNTTNRAGYTSLVVSPCRLKLYACCTDAKLYAFNIGTYSSEPIATYRSSGSSSFFCKINLSPDGKFLSSGSSDGLGYIWSVAYPDMHLVSLDGHRAEVTCVDWCKYGRLRMASCSDDGTYRIWKVSSEDNPEASAGGCAKPYGPLDPTLRWRFTTKYFASHNSVPSRKRPRSLSQEMSPRKYFPSPKKLCATPKKLELAISQLPNYVVDGRSPHDPPMKPCQSPAPEADWLSRLIAATPPPPIKPGSSTKKNRRTPSQSSKTTARGSLLKYFKKAAGESTSEQND
uniref:Denticleless A n=2 Tax=Lygus hesperus TaxID=30085 RepID=A0A0A9YP80_LYGHE